LELAAVVTLGIVAVYLGATATAWRRATVFIARRIGLIRACSGNSGTPFSDIAKLTNAEINLYTPVWLFSRYKLVIGILLVTATLSSLFFAWYYGLAVFVGLFVLVELAAFLFPHRADLYYVAQIYDTFILRLLLHERIGQDDIVQEFWKRLYEIENAYKDESSLQEFWSKEKTRAGLTYLDEKNGTRDPIRAYVWLVLAELKEGDPSIDIRDELAGLLAPNEKMEARRLIRASHRSQYIGQF
jgi:hypothetical protein